MNNTINNNLSKTIQTKQIKQEKFVLSLNLMVLLSRLIAKEFISVLMFWTPSIIESTFSSKD